MLGLDDSEKSNFLERIDVVLCLGTLEVPVFLQCLPTYVQGNTGMWKNKFSK